jgi:hypothetical protein
MIHHLRRRVNCGFWGAPQSTSNAKVKLVLAAWDKGIDAQSSFVLFVITISGRCASAIPQPDF